MNVFLRTLAATRSIPKTATMLGYSTAQAIALTELLTKDQADTLAQLMEEP